MVIATLKKQASGNTCINRAESIIPVFDLMHKLSSLNIQLENLKAVLTDLQVQYEKEEEIRKIILQIKEVEKLISKQSSISN